MSGMVCRVSGVLLSAERENATDLPIMHERSKTRYPTMVAQLYHFNGHKVLQNLRKCFGDEVTCFIN